MSVNQVTLRERSVLSINGLGLGTNHPVCESIYLIGWNRYLVILLIIVMLNIWILKLARRMPNSKYESLNLIINQGKFGINFALALARSYVAGNWMTVTRIIKLYTYLEEIFMQHLMHSGSECYPCTISQSNSSVCWGNSGIIVQYAYENFMTLFKCTRLL